MIPTSPTSTDGDSRKLDGAQPLPAIRAVGGEATLPPAPEADKGVFVQLLKSGEIRKFNELRPQGRIDLSGADLSGLDLRGVDLSDAVLNGTSFERALLSTACLRGANLRDATLVAAKCGEADFTGAILDRADCREAEFRKAILEHVHAERAFFRRCDFTEAKASNAVFSYAQLQEATLDRAQFAESTLKRADLSGARGARADFARADCESADFSRCRLEDGLFDLAVLKRAHLDEASFRRSSMNGITLTRANGRKVQFQDSLLQGAVLEHADLPEASFDRCALSRSNAFRATFERASFKNVLADHMSFNGANLDRASMDGGWFNEATFRQSQLSQVTAEKASFVKCRFELAVLEGLKAAASDFTEASFLMSFFNNAVFEGSNLTKSIFSQAQGESSSFKGALVKETNFRMARIAGAKFDGAMCEGTAPKFHACHIEEAETKKIGTGALAVSFAPIKRPEIANPLHKLNNTPDSVVLASLMTVEQRQEYEASQHELLGLVGLAEVKQIEAGLAASLRNNKAREIMGLPLLERSNHTVYMGGPGTGKTTVARLRGRSLKALGYLEKGHVVEVDRSGLVGTHVGQTEDKTLKVCQSALGGILFIDEAYALAEGGENDYGPKAIEVILKFMEDNRKNFVVIVAGYPGRIRKFIESNPGLASRFKDYIMFPDYKENELAEIYGRMAGGKLLEMEGTVAGAPLVLSHFLKIRADENFANARTLRNAFEDTTKRQAARLDKQESVTRKDLSTLVLDDFPFAETTGIPVSAIPWEKLRFNVKDEDGKVIREVGCDEIAKTVINPDTKHDLKVGYPEPTEETARIFAELAAKHPYVPKHKEAPEEQPAAARAPIAAPENGLTAGEVQQLRVLLGTLRMMQGVAEHAADN